MRRIRLFILLLLLPLLVVTAAIAAATYWLRSAEGLAWLKTTIEEAASTPGEMELRIAALNGDPFSSLEVTGLSLADPDGTWLGLDRLRLDWRIDALFSRRLEISSLEAGTLSLARLPAATADEQETKSELSIPDLPFGFQIDRLVIAQIDLGQDVIGEAASLSLSGRLKGREPGELTSFLDLQRLDGDLRVKADAAYSIGSGRLRLSLDASEGSGGLIAKLAGDPALPAVALHLTGDAPLTEWKGEIAASLEGQATLDGTLLISSHDVLEVAFDGLLDLPLTAGSAAAELLPGHQEFSLQLQLPDSARLEIKRFVLAGPVAAARVTGSVDLTSLEAALEGSVNLVDASALTKLAPDVQLDSLAFVFSQTGLLTAPALHLEASISGLRLLQHPGTGPSATSANLVLDSQLLDPESKHLALSGVVRLDGLVLPDMLQPGVLLGGSPSLEVAGELNGDVLVLTLSRLHLQGALLDARASGVLPLNGGDADLSLEAEIPDIAPLGAMAGQALTGSALLTAKVTGPLDGSGAKGQAKLDISDFSAIDQPQLGALIEDSLVLATDFSFGADSGVALSNLALSAANLSVGGSLSLGADFDELGGNYKVSIADISRLAVDLGLPIDGGLTIDGQLLGSIAQPGSRFTASLPGLEAAGSLILPANATLPQGNVTLSVADAKHWRALAGLPQLQGSGQMKITLAGSAAAPELQAAGILDQLVLAPSQTIESATFEARLTDLLGNPGGSFTLDLSGIAASDTTLDTARLTAKGTAEKLDLRLDAKGTQPLARKQQPLALTLEARASELTGGQPRIVAQTGRLELAGQVLSIMQPVDLRITENGIRLAAPELALDDARFAVTFTKSARGGDLDAQIANLPLELMELVSPGAGVAGRLDAKVKVSGKPMATGTIDVSASDLKFSAEKRLNPLRATLAGRLDGKTLDLNVEATGFAEDPLTARASLPFRVNMASLSADLPQTGQLTGDMTWAGDLAPFVDIFGPANQRMGGQARLDARLSGTPASPRVDGSLNLDGGFYENLEQGTLLQDLTAALRFNGDRIILETLTASDGSSGTLSATGNVELQPERGYPVSLAAELSRMDLVRQDHLKATISGDLTLRGSLVDPILEGDLASDLVEVSIANDLPAEVVDLEVIDRNAPPPVEAANQGPRLFADMQLALNVELPRQVFVRGRGLDSEWSGGFDVSGKLSEPSVIGSLEVVRGQMTIAGKIFKITKGTIRLPNRPGAPPVIDLTAEYKTDGLQVIAKIFGPSDAIEVELSSVPTLPQDEILARVLFNKRGSELSAVEALQLASAVGQLSGKTGGVDLMDSIRQGLGVDVLRVDGGSENAGPSVEAGTYLSEDLFLGVEQGADPRSSGVSVELEVTPNISVESKLKQSGSSNLGVLFEWDY